LFMKKLLDPGQTVLTCFKRGDLGQRGSTRVARLLGGGTILFGSRTLESKLPKGLFGAERDLPVPSGFIRPRVRPAVLGADLLQRIALTSRPVDQ
jgi:hypothetical protein